MCIVFSVNSVKSPPAKGPDESKVEKSSHTNGGCEGQVWHGGRNDLVTMPLATENVPRLLHM